MSNELKVEHCPRCGRIYQKNVRNMCRDCATEEDKHLQAIEGQMKRNRQLNNDQLSALTSIPVPKIRFMIRIGRIKLYDYPNLTDACDLCSADIRQGKLCVDCSIRIQSDIKHELAQQGKSKERTFFTKKD